MDRRTRRGAPLTAAALIALSGPLAAPARGDEGGEVDVEGFRREAAYTDGEGRPVGGLYAHEATGLTVRVLRIESVPQVFVHVATPPPGDGGEPHTGEHLLLGKGTVGKAMAAAEEMSLVESTAYTDQTEVCYAFNCAAGPDTFFRVLDQTLAALLYPDYSDEEIRREVCHLGVVTDPATGERALEEKGTVYNEMVSTYEKRWVVFYELYRRLYGEGHPLGNSSGGTPEGIRALTPERIRAFHRDHYHLANMGLVASLPPAIPTDAFLSRLDGILAGLAARDPAEGARAPAGDLPPVRPTRDRSIARVPFPSEDEQATGYVVMGWPPRPRERPARHLLRRLFLEAFADGETGALYKVLIDSSTRRLPVAASMVWGYLDTTEVSAAPVIGLTGYRPEAATGEDLRAVERTIRAEVDALAALEPGDERLVRFTRRVETRLLELERGLKRRLSMPPLFGRRGGGGFWIEHLRLVDRTGGDERSLVLAGAIDEVRAVLADAERNPWAAVIDDLGLRDAPIVGVSVPSAAEAKRRAAAREERLAAALEELTARLGAADADAALRRLEAEGREALAELEARDAEIPPARLVDDVPRTLDDDLDWGRVEVAGVPGLAARFEAMSAAEVALAFRLDDVRPDELVYLPLLPSLVGGAGLRGADGERLAYDELRDRLEREIGDLGASFDLRPERDRYELTVIASGADEAEARTAIGWLRRCLLEVDLSPENLPRLRDLVRQRASDLRETLGRSEESWVRNPARALRFQTDPLYLSGASLFTRLHHLFRLRWLLTAPPAGEDAARLEDLLARVEAAAEADDVPGALEALAAELAAAADDDAEPAAGGEAPADDAAAFREGLGRPLVGALRDLAEDLPPATAGADLREVLAGVRRDLARPPAEALADLRGLFDLLRPRPGATRLVLTGRAATLEALEPDLEALLGDLRAATPDPRPSLGPAARLAGEPRVHARALARAPDGAPTPVHLALVHDETASGVFVLSADLAAPLATGRDDLLDLLAGSVDSGAGPHAFFMNTWAEGLAYSNGLRSTPIAGRISYYAERCPDLVQTMRFVAGLATDADRYGPDLAEYAVAQLVSAHRVSDRFESRARAMAADLEDGITPEAVAAQREALMALREEPGLWDEIAARREAVEGRVLVGVGEPARAHPGGVYLVIAPEPLVAEWAAHVRRVEGEDERVHRVWPADFWIR